MPCRIALTARKGDKEGLACVSNAPESSPKAARHCAWAGSPDSPFPVYSQLADAAASCRACAARPAPLPARVSCPRWPLRSSSQRSAPPWEVWCEGNCSSRFEANLNEALRSNKAPDARAAPRSCMALPSPGSMSWVPEMRLAAP